MEGEARRAYIALKFLLGHTVEVEERGLVVDKNRFWLGASVDGVVKVLSPSTDTGLLEIKCPYVDNTNEIGRAHV